MGRKKTCVVWAIPRYPSRYQASYWYIGMHVTCLPPFCSRLCMFRRVHLLSSPVRIDAAGPGLLLSSDVQVWRRGWPLLPVPHEHV